MNVIWTSPFFRYWFFWGVVALIAFMFFGRLGFGVALLTSVMLLSFSDRIFLMKHKNLIRPSKGLEVSFEKIIIKNQLKKTPRFLLSVEPAPYLFLVRGLWTPPVIVLSQGLVLSSQPEELDQILEHCLLEAQKKQVIFSTGCCLILSLVCSCIEPA